MSSSMIFSAAQIVLSIAKLNSSVFHIQRKMPFINMLNKIGPSIDLELPLKVRFEKYFKYYLF